MTNATTAEQASPAGMGIPFSVASRPQRRFSAVYSVDNTLNAGSFPVIQLAATGWVRKISLFITQTAAFASGGALGTGDGPFALLRGITLTDATGQPVMQPVSGYNLYLLNKYSGASANDNTPSALADPVMSPEYDYTATATTAKAVYRLDIQFEIDHRTGYGCIPNLDSNASLQLKVDYGQLLSAFNGISPAGASLSMRVETDYWAPVGSSVGGVAVDATPPGVGDYLETRYETQTTSANSENLVNFTNRGGLVKTVIMVCRNGSGVRVDPVATSNVGILLDNQPIDEGIPFESHQNAVRRQFGLFGATVAVPAKVGAGVTTGLDTGVVVLPFHALSGGRDSWLNTRAGSLFQAKVTPGAASTQLEIVTQLAQVKEASAFYNVGVA